MMIPAPDPVHFTLEDLQQAAMELLAGKPDAVVTYRLRREVLRSDPSDPRMEQARNAAMAGKWVKTLENAQLPDGSWGRFHSQDTKQKTVFRTTEEAIDRAVALGLDLHHPVLWRAHQYILNVLHGEARITDREEKAESWPLLIKLILAGRLAQIDPESSALEPYWSYLAAVAKEAFKSGTYQLEDEVTAYRRLSGISVPTGFLESQHALWILSARQLPAGLDRAIVNWIWSKPDGMRYIRVPLADPQPRQMGYWIRSATLLTRFNSWRRVSANMLDRIWQQRDEHGMLDFGADTAGSVEFPLSDSWRQAARRRVDYSTSLLALLRNYFD